MAVHIVQSDKWRRYLKGAKKFYEENCVYVTLKQSDAIGEVANRSFADSKTLKEEKRDSLFQEIAQDSSIGTAVDVLDARTISAQMLHR